MKQANGLITECTEKELYELYIANRNMLGGISYDDYKARAVESNCMITEPFVEVECVIADTETAPVPSDEVEK